ncbi:MAG: hypothetical protein ACYDBB_04690 [Armatimonadota bacterium]
MMRLRMSLEKPTYGYWDGGVKDTFDFVIDGTPQSDARGAYIRIGAWGANHWFHVALAKTVKATLANARRRLVARAKRDGINCRFTYIPEEPNAFERRVFGA